MLLLFTLHTNLNFYLVDLYSNYLLFLFVYNLRPKLIAGNFFMIQKSTSPSIFFAYSCRTHLYEQIGIYKYI